MISHRQCITHGAVSDNSCAGSWWANSWLLCVLSPIWPSDPFMMSNMTFSLWKTIALPLLVSFHPTLCLVLLTSLTYSSKWAWHLSHCLTKVCVWAVFREVRPSLGHTNQLQTKALDRWVESLSTPLGCTLAWGSNLLHPLWPSPFFILVPQMGLASIPGHWSLPGSLRGRKQSAAALPREPPECAFCQPHVC